MHCYKKYNYWYCNFCYNNKATKVTSCCNLGYLNCSSFVSQEQIWGNKGEAVIMADWIKNIFHMTMFKEILKASCNNQASIFAFTFKFKDIP